MVSKNKKETAEATTTKTVNEKEREIANKKEEEGFKSLVIAQVNDYVNERKREKHHPQYSGSRDE